MSLINKSTRKIIYLILFAVYSLCCKAQSAVYKDPIPKHDTYKIKSEKVGETRVVNVWTPVDYAESSERFPVLYMPDGGIKEDFPHIANTLAKLIADKKIPSFMLVGIENTERGRDLTGFSEVEADAKYCPLSDGAKDFRVFITDELVPFINKNYRTADRKGIIGESLAGLFVTETFLEHPDTFDFYIAMDPSLWWNDHYLVRNATPLLGKFPQKDIKFWFAGSAAEDISIYTKALAEALKKRVPKNLTWTYSDEPDEKHNTIFRATKEKAMIWAMNSL